MRPNGLRAMARAILLVLACAMVGAPAASLSAQEKSFLWKASGANNTVYILGSIHLLKRDNAALKPIVLEVFAKSKRLVFEIDLLKEGPAKLQQLLLQKGVNGDGKLLQQQLSPETYKLAAQRSSELGVDLKLLAPLKPWVVALTMVTMQLQKLGYDPNLGIDRQLAERAQQAHKPVAGLETAESQLEIFNRLTLAQQEMFLRQALAEMDLLSKAVDDMVSAWRGGDVGRGEQLFLGSMAGFPELKEQILDRRNRNWLPQIEQLLKQDEDVLLVVGSAHLVGAQGVIELLKGRGYRLEQM